MNFTAGRHTTSRGAGVSPLKRTVCGFFALTALLAVGLFASAAAQGQTTLTLDLKGVTPTNTVSWLSLSLNGRFDVLVDGSVIGRITANPTADQLTNGATETLTLADGSVTRVTIVPVAADFSEGFLCEGNIPLSITPGEANRKTVFAYAKRGFFRVNNTLTGGNPANGAEFAVLDAQGNVVLSLTTDESGAYTAEQPLPNGTYQLVQMRAPKGGLLQKQPAAFTVDTYFGDAASIPTVTVENQYAPLYNATTGNLTLASEGFTLGGDAYQATVNVSGLCESDNDVPLDAYTLTLAAGLASDGASLPELPEGAGISQITVHRPDGGTCVAQPLDGAGNPLGETLTCASENAVPLPEGTAAVALTYWNENGEPTVPAKFVAGTVDAVLRYPTTSGADAGVKVQLNADVRYTFHYAGEDGISEVEAPSTMEPIGLALGVTDGSVTPVEIVPTTAAGDATVAPAQTETVPAQTEVATTQSESEPVETAAEPLTSGSGATLTGAIAENGAGVSVLAVSVDAQHTATVDADGSFAFADLTPGDYTVYAPLPAGYAPADDSQWRVSERGDMLWLTVSVKAGETLALPNISYTAVENEQQPTTVGEAQGQTATLKVAAFFDSNENGARGVYERAITGVTVQVASAADPNGPAVAEGVTGASGEATIANVPAGEQILRVILPDGYQYTVAGDGWQLDQSCIGRVDGLAAQSAPVTFAVGQTVEAGVAAIPVGSFSGKVWKDTNNNGVMDEGEPGMGGVKLTLKGVKTGNAYEFTTDETGVYRFTQLRNDSYQFTADIDDTLLFARYSLTGGDKRSVFTVEGSSATRQFAVTDAGNVTDKNVGVIDKAILNGIAFLDLNYNGVYDEGEPPYKGVTVEIIKNSNDKSMGKAVTGEDGRYRFDSLRGGDYRLRAILPNDGCIFTAVPSGASGLINLFAAREGRRENSIPSVTVVNGATLETCVGVAMGGTVTGTVSQDLKYDGVRNSSDKKLSGFTVQLVAADGELAATDTTNANGRYTLTGIMPGEYTVRVQRKEGYAFTRYRPDEENGNHIKLLAKDGFGETEPIQVAMGQTIEGIDAGMLPSSTLTGVFFDDLNDNGLQDAEEKGFVAGQVRLLSEDGEIDLTEPVKEDGTYFFDGVMPGKYTVAYLLPDHATMANAVEGGNTLAPQGRENVLEGLTVESGKGYAAPLVGAVTLGSLAGEAYHDANANGARDAGEEAMAGVTVTLAQSGSITEPATAVTDGEGKFALDLVRPGAYTLQMTAPDGYIFSADLAPIGLALDAANQTAVACPWSALVNREAYAIGVVRPATIGASVWLDENRDGRQAESEQRFGGLGYELFDESKGQVVKTAAANEDGYVTFSDVRPATYTVRFPMPAQAQPANAEGDTMTLQDGYMRQTGIVVREGETVNEISGGLVSYTSIGGEVALDENGTRTPLAGVTVELYQAETSTALQTVQTDESGAYRFDGLWPDEYHIAVALPTGMIFVRPDDPNYTAGDSAVVSTENGYGLSGAITLMMAKHQLDTDVLLIKPARVGDQVWLDSNQNGLIDTDEPTLNGVTVNLMDNGTVAYTTVSNEWGYYEFADVYPGTYTLMAQAYPELEITQAVPGLQIISSCLTSGDGESATSESFQVESGSRNFDYNLGYVLPEGKTLPEGIVPGAGQRWVR